MTKKPETVKEEDLIKRKDGLYYKKYTKIPFTGTSEQFHTNGQLKSKDNYKNGKEDGVWERFYENGQLNIRQNFKNGQPEGHWEYFDKEGNLTKTETWDNGQLVE